MASVHRRPASKYWHAFFRDSEGRLVDKSTRLKDRKQAQRVADTLEMAAQRKKSAQHVRAAFAQIFQDTYQETMSIATSRSYADQWLETKKPETARATLHSYSITISAFLDFLGSKADRDLSEVARADLIAFRNSLAGKLSKHLDQSVHIGFAHAFQNGQAGPRRIRPLILNDLGHSSQVTWEVTRHLQLYADGPPLLAA